MLIVSSFLPIMEVSRIIFTIIKGEDFMLVIIAKALYEDLDHQKKPIVRI